MAFSGYFSMTENAKILVDNYNPKELPYGLIIRIKCVLTGKCCVLSVKVFFNFLQKNVFGIGSH